MAKKKILRAVTVSSSVGFFVPIIKDLQESGYEIVAVSSPGKELHQLETRGVKTITVPMERRMSPFKDIKSLCKLVRVFHKEKPDIVHSMTPKAGLLCMLAGWIARVPIRIHTFTGLVWPTSQGLFRKVLQITDWLTCACATHINPEGVGVMDDLKQISKKPMKVLGFGNVRGVDIQKFSRRTEVIDRACEIQKKEVFTFLFVGRLVGDKGINELVASFVKLYCDIGGVRLLLVGKYENNLDPLKPETESLINDCSAIEVVGSKYGDDLLAYYAASDCFVFPSYREGFPNVVLEAGAMELPCIVTDINGSREIIENGVNGLVIPSKNKTALYQAMKELVVNVDLKKKLSQNSRSIIANRYEQNYVKKCLLKYYDDILNSNRSGNFT